MAEETQEEKTVFLVAGGTGGHVFPALSVAEELLARGIKVECITDTRGEKYFKQTNLVPHTVASSAWAKDWPGRLKAGFKIVQGLVHSLELCREYGPSCVVGFGGYPSFPTVKAAQILKIPTILHEQNAVFGRANRRVSKLAKMIATSFEETKFLHLEDKNKIVVTGNPLRQAFVNAAKPYQAPAPGQPIHLLIFGGSQGSKLFSDVIPAGIAKLPRELRSRLSVSQQTRFEDVEMVKNSYQRLDINARVQPFFADMLQQYNRAHLIISRAGASTVTELTALGRPAIFIPLAASLDGDQAQNAHQLVAHRAGWMMEEKNFTAESLGLKLIEIFDNPGQLQKAAEAATLFARPDATRQLADVIMKLV